jgi:transcriptional regulator with XRE-family HTH domain
MERPVYLSPIDFPDMQVSIQGFGDRLAIAMLDKGVNDEQVGDAVGIAPSTVGRIRREKSNPTFLNVILLVNYLQVDPMWLMFGRRPKQPLWFLDPEQVEKNPQEASAAALGIMNQCMSALKLAHSLTDD